MSNTTIYAVERSDDHEDRLYEIMHLATVGAASADTSLNIKHLHCSLGSLFEIIHRLASEAVDMSETSKKGANVANTLDKGAAA